MKKTDIERVLRNEPNAVFQMDLDWYRGRPTKPHLTAFAVSRLETIEWTNYLGSKIRRTRAHGTKIVFHLEKTDGGQLRYRMVEAGYDCEIRDISHELLVQVEGTDLPTWRPQSKEEWITETMHQLDRECRAHDAKQHQKNDLVRRWQALDVLDDGTVYGDFVDLPPVFQKLIVRLTETAEQKKVEA